MHDGLPPVMDMATVLISMIGFNVFKCHRAVAKDAASRHSWYNDLNDFNDVAVYLCEGAKAG